MRLRTHWRSAVLQLVLLCCLHLFEGPVPEMIRNQQEVLGIERDHGLRVASAMDTDHSGHLAAWLDDAS